MYQKEFALFIREDTYSQYNSSTFVRLLSQLSRVKTQQLSVESHGGANLDTADEVHTGYVVVPCVRRLLSAADAKSQPA